MLRGGMVMRLLNDGCEPKMMSAASLSFIGDCVYSLFVRERLCCSGLAKSGELHSLSAKKVRAQAQARDFKCIEPLLTETELSVYKRGRNAHNKNIPKAASGAEYNCATGIEALFGYLYLSGESERAAQLFEIMWDNGI